MKAKSRMLDAKTRLEHEISATDREIDRLVYELYRAVIEELLYKARLKT